MQTIRAMMRLVVGVKTMLLSVEVRLLLLRDRLRKVGHRRRRVLPAR